MNAVASILLAAWLFAIAGCASGPPTLTFEAKPFLKAYIAQRDRTRDQTKAARDKCDRVSSVAPDALKAKCAQLQIDRDAWDLYDAAVLEAVLTRQTIRGEDIEKAGEWAAKILKLAGDILL
jgi:hypothetical protein